MNDWLVLLLMSMVVMVNLHLAARRDELAGAFYACAGLMLFFALMLVSRGN